MNSEILAVLAAVALLLLDLGEREWQRRQTRREKVIRAHRNAVAATGGGGPWDVDDD